MGSLASRLGARALDLGRGAWVPILLRHLHADTSDKRRRVPAPPFLICKVQTATAATLEVSCQLDHVL